MNHNKDGLVGGLAVSAAYASWGLLVIFWNLLAGVDSLYILSQRVIWSMVVMGLYALVKGQWPQIRAVFRSPSQLGLCALCGLLITVNWGVYIYAVTNGHALDASLGYFIEPVAVALFGILCFHERPRPLEKLTFALAILGIVYLVVSSGVVPVLALVIAGTFSVYGALKKRLTLEPSVGLFMETLCVTPFALAFMLYADSHGMAGASALKGWELLLLPACGVVTSLPLMWFSLGVKKIPYYVSGILEYISPTLQFLVGLCYLREPLDQNRLIAFILIWIGVGFAMYDKLSLRHARAVAPGSVDQPQ